MRFQEKKILVTEAGDGIGLAVAWVTINDINPDWVAEVMENGLAKRVKKQEK